MGARMTYINEDDCVAFSYTGGYIDVSMWDGVSDFPTISPSEVINVFNEPKPMSLERFEEICDEWLNDRYESDTDDEEDEEDDSDIVHLNYAD